jgi:ornithine carbamoyltransferase
LAQHRFLERASRRHRSLLTVNDLSQTQVRDLIGSGLRMKTDSRDVQDELRGLAVALLFQKTSTRTRCSFEAAARELGATVSYIDWSSSNFVLANIRDEAAALSRFYDFIVARLRSHQTLRALDAGSEVSVINGLCDQHHPCQAISDFVTLTEYFGTSLRGLRIAYIGDGNNVCRSLVQAASAMSATVVVCSPPGYDLDEETEREAGNVIRIKNPYDAVKDADVVYTDSWVSIGQEAHRAERLAAFEGYQVDTSLMNQATSHALFMHCLPAYAGIEVSAEVLGSCRSIVLDQAENRKHAQKALLLHMKRVHS